MVTCEPFPAKTSSRENSFDLISPSPDKNRSVKSAVCLHDKETSYDIVDHHSVWLGVEASFLSFIWLSSRTLFARWWIDGNSFLYLHKLSRWPGFGDDRGKFPPRWLICKLNSPTCIVSVLKQPKHFSFWEFVPRPGTTNLQSSAKLYLNMSMLSNHVNILHFIFQICFKLIYTKMNKRIILGPTS